MNYEMTGRDAQNKGLIEIVPITGYRFKGNIKPVLAMLALLANTKSAKKSRRPKL